MIISFAIIILISIWMLSKGANLLVDNVLYLGLKLNINTAFLGIIIIGFGTSLPEMIVSVASAFKDKLYISYGNIIGSNIVNILLILAVAVLFSRTQVKHITIYDKYFLLLSNILFAIFIGFFLINFFVGVAFLIITSIYLWKTYQVSKDNVSDEKINQDNTLIGLLKAIVLLIVGFILLFLGADVLVESSTIIAKKLDISEKIIGVTIVAIGTSLPELSASIVSIIKKNTHLAVANIIGSNIFNVTFIPFASSIIKPFKDYHHLFYTDLVFFLLSLSMLSVIIYKYDNKYIPRIMGLFGILTYVLYCYILLY